MLNRCSTNISWWTNTWANNDGHSRARSKAYFQALSCPVSVRGDCWVPTSQRKHWTLTETSSLITWMTNQTLFAHGVPFHPSGLRLHASSSMTPSQSSPFPRTLTKPLSLLRIPVIPGPAVYYPPSSYCSCSIRLTSPELTQCSTHSRSSTKVY